MNFDDESFDDESFDELMRLVGKEIDAQSAAVPLNEELLTWLAWDLREAQSGDERRRDELAATAFAKRAVRRLSIQRVEKTLPMRELRYRAAPIVASVAVSMEEASRKRCATILDLAVAAGSGRELWDEPCEEWLELPSDIPSSPRYLALRVSGDSMSPVLGQNDVILMKLDAWPAVDDLVVAKIPDDGYVVKRFAGIKTGRVELSSFNQAYDVLSIPRNRLILLGTVIARFKRE